MRDRKTIAVTRAADDTATKDALESQSDRKSARRPPGGYTAARSSAREEKKKKGLQPRNRSHALQLRRPTSSCPPLRMCSLFRSAAARFAAALHLKYPEWPNKGAHA